MTIRQFPLLAVALFFLSVYAKPLHAGASNQSGNPFGNGSQFSNSGTFSAIMRGPNLMGVTQFSIFQDGSYPSTGWNMLNGQSANTMKGGVDTNTGTFDTVATNNRFGTPGFVSVYYNGSTYNGPAFSILNPSDGEVASVFYTFKAGNQIWNPGAGLTLNQSGPVINTNTTLTVSNVAGTAYVNSLTNTNISWNFSTNQVSLTNSLANATANQVYAGSYNYYDGNWTANFQNKYPNQIFKGSGVISLGQPANPSNPSPINQPNGGNNIVQITYQVSGVRVSSSTSKIY